MNPKQGDVGFKVGAKNYILNMGVNAMCLVEHAVNAPAMEVVEKLIQSPRLTEVRLLLWAGLQRHHPGIDLDQAGDIVQALNKGERKGYEYILESMKLCSPDVEDANAPADPPPEETATVDGTGTPSS